MAKVTQVNVCPFQPKNIVDDFQPCTIPEFRYKQGCRACTVYVSYKQKVREKY